MKKVLIFTKSGESCHNLAILLKQFGLSVDELSSKVNILTSGDPNTGLVPALKR